MSKNIKVRNGATANVPTTGGDRRIIFPDGIVNNAKLSPDFRGLIPVGAVIPVLDNITGASIPATGVVSADGYMYCDGSAIPAGNSLSGNTPNLTEEIFLMGSVSAGIAGGNNDATHYHIIPGHRHEDLGTLRIDGPSGSHQHTQFFTVETGTDQQMLERVIEAQSGSGHLSNCLGSDSNSLQPAPFPKNVYAASTGSDHTHPHSSFSGYVGSGGAIGDYNYDSLNSRYSSSSLFTDNRPKYLSVKYLIRVK